MMPMYHQPERTYIRTFTGRKVHPLKLVPGDVDIRDIAHALSNLCRYTGHTKWHYSVAQHSLYVSEMVPAKYKLWGLLHDASEAYLNDIARPVKQTATFDDYRRAEKSAMQAAAFRFGLSYSEPAVVKMADGRMLMTEIRQLMHGHEEDTPWSSGYGFPIKRLYPDEVEGRFLRTFYRLWDGREFCYAQG